MSKPSMRAEGGSWVEREMGKILLEPLVMSGTVVTCEYEVGGEGLALFQCLCLQPGV